MQHPLRDKSGGDDARARVCVSDSAGAAARRNAPGYPSPSGTHGFDPAAVDHVYDPAPSFALDSLKAPSNVSPFGYTTLALRRAREARGGVTYACAAHSRSGRLHIFCALARGGCPRVRLPPHTRQGHGSTHGRTHTFFSSSPSAIATSKMQRDVRCYDRKTAPVTCVGEMAWTALARPFAGRVVCVTGGADGIGRGICEGFLRAGATVM